MWKDLGEYIENLANSHPNNKNKIVEIAIGKFFEVSNYLKENNNIELILTDINPDKTYNSINNTNKIIKDDITNPNLEIYKNTKLIYSIRPQYELQEHIISLAEQLNVTLIIKPLFNDDLYNKNKFKLKNYKTAIFYIMNEKN
ncbi:MAG: hypothetical protein LBM96_02960 [Methanobrevibacter sp.]|jgi:uncharacterized UPF0146 family protein|nr:hypothetical protein [Candidatus Methanoflexus mossambicus]